MVFGKKLLRGSKSFQHATAEENVGFDPSSSSSVNHSSGDDMEEKIRRKLEGSKSVANVGATHSHSSSSTSDAYEERLRRKLETEQSSGKKQTPRRPMHLSASMSMADDAYEERLRRKMQGENGTTPAAAAAASGSRGATINRVTSSESIGKMSFNDASADGSSMGRVKSSESLNSTGVAPGAVAVRSSKSRSSSDDLEEKIRRKLEGNKQGRRDGRDGRDGSNGHSASDAYEDRIRSKLSNNESSEKRKTSSRPMHLSASMSSADEYYEERLRRKLQGDKASTSAASRGSSSGASSNDSYEEKVRKKLANDEPAVKAAIDTPGKSSVGAFSSNSARDSFEERLQRKMESEKGASANVQSKVSSKHSRNRLAASMIEIGPASASQVNMRDSLTKTPSVFIGSSSSAADAYEEKIRRKLEKECNGTRNDIAINGSIKSPGMKAVGMAGSANDDFEERIQRKMKEGKPSGTSTSMGRTYRKSSSMPEDSSDSIEEKIRRKLEKEAMAREKGEKGKRRRPKFIKCSLETEDTLTDGGVESITESESKKQQNLSSHADSTSSKTHKDQLRQLLKQKRNVKNCSIRPSGLSSSLPLDSEMYDMYVHDEEDMDGKADMDQMEHCEVSGEKLSLDERIALKNRKNINRRELLAKGSAKVPAEEDEEEAFRQRMSRRSLRAGLNRNNSSRMNLGVENVYIEAGKDEERNEENAVFRCASASNLCPGSWECKTCSFINEPVGLDERAQCRICGAPRPSRRDSLKTNESFKVEDLVSSNTKQRDKRDTWSDLGEAINLAKLQSMVEHNCSTSPASKKEIRPPQNHDFVESWSELGNIIDQVKDMSAQGDTSGSNREESAIAAGKQKYGRRGSCSESWCCQNCYHRNLDGVAVFCGVCGKQRF